MDKSPNQSNVLGDVADNPEPTDTAVALYPQPQHLHTAHFDQLHSRIAELESQLSVLHSENHRMKGTVEQLIEEQDRETRIRPRTLRLRQPPAPRFEDGYYIYRMQDLNESVKSWIVSAFKAKEMEQPMSATEEEQLVHLLRTTLPEHIVWLEALRQRLGITYTSIQAKPHARIALARHLVALSIWKNIFRPTCFGISGELKNGIRTVMDAVYASENEFQLVLVTKQAIGRGLLRHLGPSHEQLKQFLVESLDQILTLLLPMPYRLLPKLKKTINMAVELKNEMICEQALFESRMIRSEEPFSPHKMEISQDRQSGSVFACTFPALMKTEVDADDNKIDLVLFKANVELESVFLDSR